MGIKELWSILGPFCERKPLYELQGKTVAIDLAGWICEALTVLEYSTQPRFYLRNLYFRTCYLLLMGVNPVFVLDGKAPVLKYDTIAQRNAIQFKGSRPNNGKVKTGKDRTRFNAILKQCAELLSCMGIKCVQGAGEAEALCAYLNEDGFVDGCISQDSDCFVYGAKVVYRNFSVSHQGASAAAGGAVDIYDIRVVQRSMDFGRNKMVALALLCGCDYNTDGVTGIGRDAAIKFLNRFKDTEILNRLKSWRENASYFEKLERKVNDPNICTSCGHYGKIQKHTRSGCIECNREKGCDSSLFREERVLIKHELAMRSKALTSDKFPDQELIDEFLNRNEEIPRLNLKWKKPELLAFAKFTLKMLSWEEIYSVEKFIPILTRWQLLNYVYIERTLNENPGSIPGLLYPDYIKKKRVLRGVPSYEIVWKDDGKYFDNLIPQYQLDELQKNSANDNILESIWSTIEPQDLVQKAYPTLVEIFMESKVKKKDKKIGKKRAKEKENTCVNDLEKSLHNLSITEKPKKIRKRSKKDNVLDSSTNLEQKKSKTDKNIQEKGLQKISNFFNVKNDVAPLCSTPKTNNFKSDTPKEKYETNNIKLSSYEYFANSFDFNSSNLSDFEKDSNMDLSEIVDMITKSESLENLKTTNKCVRKIVENESDEEINSNEVSHFFESLHTGKDMFEKTFDKLDIDISDTDEDDVIIIDKDNKENDSLVINEIPIHNNDISDSFDLPYVPLIDRIRNKLH